MTMFGAFLVAYAVTLAILWWLSEDEEKDETIGQDQFKRERAAILEQVQAEQRQRFVQRKERA